MSNLKLTTFSSYVDIVTDENGYFVLGTSATPNVSNPFFDDPRGGSTAAGLCGYG